MLNKFCYRVRNVADHLLGLDFQLSAGCFEVHFEGRTIDDFVGKHTKLD